MDLLVCRLDLLGLTKVLEPLRDVGVLVQRQTSFLVQANPRLEVTVDGGDTTRDNALAVALLQLSLKHLVASVGLIFVSLERVLVLAGVVVPAQISVICRISMLGLNDLLVPIGLTGHRAQSGQEEVLPFLEIDKILLAAASWAQGLACVILSPNVVHDCARLPRHDAGVGILENWNTAIFVDLGKSRALDAFLRVITKVPELDFVRNGQQLESNADFDRIRTGDVGVENERFD